MSKLMKYTARLRFIKRPKKGGQDNVVKGLNIILQQQVHIVEQRGDKTQVKKKYWHDVPFYDSEMQANMACTDM